MITHGLKSSCLEISLATHLSSAEMQSFPALAHIVVLLA